MPIRTASDAVATMIAWLPLIAIAVGVAWVLATGVAALEAHTTGGATLQPRTSTGHVVTSDADVLQQALDSGDTAQMTAALAGVDARQQARAGAAVG